LFLVAVATALIASPSSASVDDGMLLAGDVSLKQTAAPHETDLIRASQVAPATCSEPATRDYTGRAVSFGAGSASLKEFVLDLSSVSDAAATFTDFRADDQATADCGDTQFREVVSLTSGPSKVGDGRYTFVSKPTINGATTTVTQIAFREGSHVALLVFTAWPSGKPSPAAIAKKAAARLT
jgi:hypothetical protein